MAVDYLKTYLGIDPNDYSAMESRIRGDEPPAQSPLMMRQPMMMPQQRSLGDISAMQMMPRQQPVQQDDSKYQGLMDEIATLRSQIEGMQAPTQTGGIGDPAVEAAAAQLAESQAPVMADTSTEVNMDDARKMFYESPEFKEYQRQTEGMAHDMAYRPQNYTDPTTGNTVSFQDRSGLFQDWYKNTYGRDLTVENRFSGSLGSGLGGVLDESKAIQAPVGIENRAVGEPQRLPPVPPRTVIHRGPTGSVEIYDDNMRPPEPDMSDKLIKRTTQAPSQDIQSSIDYLAGLPEMNIPQIPDMEEIKRKMAEANMSFPEPVSYQDQLQSIRDLPPMNQMPTREEIQMAMQNIPTSVGANITENPFRTMYDSVPQSTIDQFQSVASKPNPFVRQQPQNQSFGLPQQIAGGRTLMSDFSPRNVMRMASGGGIDKAIYDLKFKLNGS